MTERYAILPNATVCRRYFAVGPIAKDQKDQVESYAARKGETVPEVERWLSPNLGYKPTPKSSTGKK